MINYCIREGGLKLGFLEKLQDPILIAFGAVIGANIRFLIYKKLNQIRIKNSFIILIINNLASLLLGLFLSNSAQISNFGYSYKLGLFFSIGLLGSLSTFSTFIYDLCELLIRNKLIAALKFIIISIPSGVISFMIGFQIGT